MITKSGLYCIAYGCLKGTNRNNDCPLPKIEHLSFKEKIDWIDKLDGKKKEAILTHHACCTRKEIIKLHLEHICGFYWRTHIWPVNKISYTSVKSKS